MATWTTTTTPTDSWKNTQAPKTITLVQGSPMGLLLLLTNPYTVTVDYQTYTKQSAQDATYTSQTTPTDTWTTPSQTSTNWSS